MGALAVREGPFEGFYLIDLQIHEDTERQGASSARCSSGEARRTGLPAFQPNR